MFMDDEFPITMEREAGMNEHVPAVAVSFGNYHEQDAAKSAAAGHAVYRDVVFIKIAVPGDKTSLYFQPATDTHKRRFPQAWGAFEKRSAGGAALEGLPIEQWAPITRSVALTLRAAHIHTVEALAEVHDGHIDRIGIDGRGLRDQAKAFLKQAKDSSATLRLAAEKKELQDELAAMREQIRALQEQKTASKKQAVPAESAAA